MKIKVHVFHCLEAECRWGRGVEYSDETGDESLEAAAAMCALDGRMNCPLASPEQRAKLVGLPGQADLTPGHGSAPVSFP
jgi:hypothetical protein